jgi:mitochondrial chaperone BCS1
MLAAQQGKLIVFTAWGIEWKPFGKPRRKRKLESVVLDHGVKERIVEDLQNFLRRGEWYAERGESF